MYGTGNIFHLITVFLGPMYREKRVGQALNSLNSKFVQVWLLLFLSFKLFYIGERKEANFASFL